MPQLQNQLTLLRHFTSFNGTCSHLLATAANPAGKFVQCIALHLLAFARKASTNLQMITAQKILWAALTKKKSFVSVKKFILTCHA